MKIIVLGNAGAGKSTLAKRLMEKRSAACLSLDEVAFDGGVERRPLQDSVADARRFMASHEDWIIEGCYVDIIESLLDDCEELIFLNPGMEACLAHCRARPWEPGKFASKREQDEHLERLLDWVRSYETREDEYGLHRHRALYASFTGRKRECNQPDTYPTV